MGWLTGSKTWGAQERSRQRQQKAAERDAKRKHRARKARRRQEWIEHPLRTAWRNR